MKSIFSLGFQIWSLTTGWCGSESISGIRYIGQHRQNLIVWTPIKMSWHEHTFLISCPWLENSQMVSHHKEPALQGLVLINLFSIDRTLGPVSISEKSSFRKISYSLEAAIFVFRIVRSLWNLTGTSAAVLPMCLSHFKGILLFNVPISWVRDFTRSYGKTSFLILRRGPGVLKSIMNCSIIRSHGRGG